MVIVLAFRVVKKVFQGARHKAFGEFATGERMLLHPFRDLPIMNMLAEDLWDCKHVCTVLLSHHPGAQAESAGTHKDIHSTWAFTRKIWR